MFITLLAVLLIGFGILSLLFPDVARSLDRFSNEMKGVQTKQGGAYEVNRVFGGVVCIVIGIAALVIWL